MYWYARMSVRRITPREVAPTAVPWRVRERMKSLLEEKNLKGRARILATSCMDVCENGAVVCVMPDNVWYGGVRPEDAEDIVEKHLGNGEPVERLLISEGLSGLSLFG